MEENFLDAVKKYNDTGLEMLCLSFKMVFEEDVDNIDVEESLNQLKIIKK